MQRLRFNTSTASHKIANRAFHIIAPQRMPHGRGGLRKTHLKQVFLDCVYSYALLGEARNICAGFKRNRKAQGFMFRGSQ